MEGKEIVSLLSNIIDNACEELIRIKKTSFSLELKANESQLYIKEKNPCSKQNQLISNKQSSNHGYGLKIIQSIVQNYEGSIQISKQDEQFQIIILIPLL